ncbi:MAG: hypothetical protein IKV67_12130 [Paludibacteraceae bacterium]|nr:hypothetical protein [Paludibacteraceae bacterium]
MDKKEFLESLHDNNIDDMKVKKIEDLYKCDISDEVKQIVSNCDETIFFDDDSRVLSFDEILDAEEDLHVEFIKKKMLPLFDCLDNDFVVYKTDTHTWMKFNIVDEIDYEEADSLEEILEI